MAKVGRFNLGFEEVIKFEDIDKLKNDIDVFFTECGKNQQIPTVTGLALHLDCSEETIGDYIRNKEGRYRTGKKLEAARLLQKAKRRIILNMQQLLINKNVAAGVIFWLKNVAGWHDKQEVATLHSFSGVSDDELRKMLAEKLANIAGK